MPAGSGDDEYLGQLNAVLPGLLENVRPDLVLYNAGAASLGTPCGQTL